MYILGINAYHGDSSACIYKDAELIVASEEERFRRIKHWAGLPTEAIRFCLEEAGIGLHQVNTITVSRNPLAKIEKKLIHMIKNTVSLKAVLNRGANSVKINSIKKDLAEALGLESRSIKAKVEFVEHHRSHMASAFHISPYKEAAILSIDGMGDFTSTMRGSGKNTQLNILDSVSYPHSLGILYTSFTQYLGFPHYGDEYKVMGLSPYGTPAYIDKIKNVIIHFKKNGLFELNPDYFRHFKEGVSMSWEGGSPAVEPIFSDNFIQAFGPARQKGEPLTKHHKDLAASVQKVTEELIFHMAEDLYKKTRLPNLCITGGVAQNSVANGKLIQNTSFENLFVPPAGHDAGTATGSVLYHYHHVLKKPRPAFKVQPYTGIKFNNIQIKEYLESRSIEYQYLEDEELMDLVVDKLLDGGVIGWFQGRAEFGPRALGNRSILVDPRRKDAKALLNEKIKKRESFRPFAPSILKEYVGDFFIQVDDVPFMEKVFDIKRSKQSHIPAVTHVNGTGRLQTVDQAVNPRYHRLIEKFYESTDIPILLNTSFNENEPIVNTPEHALECFLRTKMDMLVLENVIVTR
ncbi:MAG: carbamoyltransferase C-terminal domain-containing protein [Bacteroidota bacterium]